ncbi:MAG: sugar ABC transporter permease [Candidatus Bathyarchaeota archaeon]|jgi:glucose/mannose transport system permease protein|nr:sugar ABC transporter permease [Candidatus Bathyarchaeota archaeon]
MRLPSRKVFTIDRVVTSFFLLLSLALVGYFVYVCIGWNVIVSLSDWKGLTPSYNIVGFDQYSSLFNDPVFLTSLKNNLILITLFVPGSLFLGLFLAILLDLKVRGEGVFRGIYLLPFALSFVVTATLWAWMYNPSIGVINTLLGKTGLEFLKSRWITDSNIAMYCVVLAIIWQFSGYTMLIFLAGIRAIPESQIRAAEVDGASGFDLYKRVVIPQLKAPALSAFVVLVVFALKAFDFIFVLTGGGPGYSTYVLPIMMFRETFSMTHFAYGAAIATILFLLALAIVLPYLYLSFRREKE